MNFKTTTLLALAALGLCPAAGLAQYFGDPGLDPRVAATHQPPTPVLGPFCDVAPPPRFAVRQPPTLWPGGVVPFVIESSVADPTVTRQAMEAWMFRSGATPNVTFVERDPDNPEHAFYISIRGVAGSVSSSPVGREMTNPPGIVSQGEQVNTYVMAHELCHTLGWDHEQCRPDRAQYVGINLAPVAPIYQHNFNLRTAADWPANSCNTPYDFDSVMHYTATAFVDPGCGGAVSCSNSQCCSIRTLPAYSAYQCSMGQLDHLSTSDVQDVINVYGARTRPVYFVGRGTGCVLSNFNFGTMQYPICSLHQVPGPGDVWIKGDTVPYRVPAGTTFTAPATWRKHGQGPANITTQ